MALTGALCCVVHAVTGFTNQSLRGLVAGLLDRDYSTNQMTYDLRRLRLHGLIERIPAHQHLHASPPTASASPCSTPRSTPASYAHSSPRPTNHPHPSNSVAPSPPSTAVITNYITNARLGTAA